LQFRPSPTDLAAPATQIGFDGVGTPGKFRKLFGAAASPLRAGDLQNKQNKKFMAGKEAGDDTLTAERLARS
jgi:hypothetical protein